MNSIPSPVASAPVNPSPKVAANPNQSPANQGGDAAADAANTAERSSTKKPVKEERSRNSGNTDKSPNAVAKEPASSPATSAARAQQNETNKLPQEPAANGGKTVKQTALNAVVTNTVASTDRPAEADAADFAVALAQTLNADGAAPQATMQQAAAPLTTKAPVSKSPVKTELSSEVDLAALQAMLGMPLPIVPPTPQPQAFVAQSAAAPATSQHDSDLLGAVAAKAGKDVLALLNEIQDNSGVAAAPVDGADSKGSTTPFTLPTHITDAPQTARAAASEAPTSSRPMHTPVGTQAWADELSARVSLMATKEGHQTASLTLTPEHLGPLEIRISVRNDQASVWFGAAHADTRAAIEHALPKLREQFASQGLSLADAGVFREPPRDNTRREVSGSASSSDRESAPVESTVAVVARRMGLVDAFV